MECEEEKFEQPSNTLYDEEQGQNASQITVISDPICHANKNTNDDEIDIDHKLSHQEIIRTPSISLRFLMIFFLL